MNTSLVIKLLVIAAVVGLALLSTRGVYLHRMLRRTVAVHLKSGTSMRGVLQGVYVDSIVLVHASAAPSGAKEFTPVDGAQVIPKANVDWMQDLNTVAAGEVS